MRIPDETQRCAIDHVKAAVDTFPLLGSVLREHIIVFRESCSQATGLAELEGVATRLQRVAALVKSAERLAAEYESTLAEARDAFVEASISPGLEDVPTTSGA